MKILVATDSRELLVVIEKALQQAGHFTIFVDTCADAIDKFRFENPELIILDLDLKHEDEDAVSAARQLRKISFNKWLPIIFIANPDDKNLRKIELAGGDDFLPRTLTESYVTIKIKLFERMLQAQEKINEDTQKFNLLSSTDSLTGVYNRYQFDKYLKEQLETSQRNNSQFALLHLDIDHFKTINDTLGHQVGDLLLKNVAKRVRNCLRMDDFIARMGSDEFIIILNDVANYDMVEKLAQKIIDALSPAYDLYHVQAHISASIGIAIYPIDGKTSQTLTQNADIAMSFAKESGRNNFQRFSQTLYEKRKNKLNLEDALKYAVDRQELFLTYQPIYHLSSKVVVGMEALICWEHPKLGLISPNVFIPLAEDIGIIDSIGKWTFQRSFAQCAKWYLAGLRDFKLSINLSPRHLLQKNLPEYFLDIIKKTAVPPDYLELELTETAVLTHMHNAEDVINGLNKIGITIALDDFGTGYSSFSHLKYLPIATIKIDKSFIDDIGTNHKNAMMVKSIIALGENLDVNIVAEGIETEEQLQILINTGCPYGQGYFLSKALSVEDMTQMLKEQAQRKKS
jgi:diguanylate cyclase (GGDEF)-like protein